MGFGVFLREGEKRSTALKDLLAIAVAAVLVLSVATHFDAFDKFTRWYVTKKEPGGLGRLIVVVFFCAFAFTIFSYRRWRELIVQTHDRKRAEKALKESTQQLADIINFLPDATLVIDMEGKVIAWNRAIEEMTGIKASEILGKNNYEYALPFYGKRRPILADFVFEPQRAVEAKYTRIEKKEAIFNAEGYMPALGVGVYLSASAAPLRDLKGNIIGAIESLRDITERKQAEEAQQVSLRFLEIVNKHTEVASLLKEYVSEIKNYTGCDAVGIRVLDENWNIPYAVYEGFSQKFYESESPLSLKSDKCMCINVIRGDVDPRLPFYTDGGGFCVNATSRFLATVSEEEKRQTRNKCNMEGYETVALFPFRSGGKIFGLIHVADHRENMIPPRVVKILEKVAMQLGTAFQRARAEGKLRESEKHYRSLFDNMLNGFAYCRMLFEKDRSQDFIYLKVNGAFETLTGLKNVAGKKASEVIPGIRESDPELLEIYGSVATTGVPKRFETYVKALGMWFSILVYSPRKEHFVAVFDVITERKRTEEALRNSEMLNRSLVEHLPQRIFIKDRQSVYLSCNALYAHDLGIEPEQIVGKDDFSFYPPELAEMYRADDRTVLATNQLKDIEERYLVVGEERWIHTVKVPYCDAEGRVTGVLGIFEDITDRKQAEEERLRVEAQLRQAQKMEALGTLAGGIAHDFNNILAIIMGYADMARWESGEGSPVRGKLDEVLKAAYRAKELVKQILAFSRKADQQKIPMQLGLIVKEALKILRPSLPSTIEIKTDVLSKVAVLGDPTQMHQVLMNLCANAAHAMQDEGGVLEVRLTDVLLGAESVLPGLQPGPHLKLTVKDTGCGIDPAVIGSIFDPFFTTKEPGEGTGLGLSVVHGIVQSHGGYINVESLPGDGTMFTVLLPACEGCASRKTEDASPLPGGQERILVVDDEPALGEILARMLERLGYRVDVRTNGIEAQEAFRHQPIDNRFHLVITDMTMPHMTGADLAQKLLMEQASLPIILLTGFSKKMDAEKIRSLGIHGFLMKPVVFEELAKLVRKVLDERTQ